MNSSAFLKIMASRSVIIFKKASELMHYPIYNALAIHCEYMESRMNKTIMN
jgi:hypothetical protein